MMDFVFIPRKEAREVSMTKFFQRIRSIFFWISLFAILCGIEMYVEKAFLEFLLQGE